jgi:hypothetical protein
MQHTTTTALAGEDRMERWPPQRRNLAAACLAHFLHDGCTDQLYALLPLWQPEFGLSYAGLALVRALYSGTMGILQAPAGVQARPRAFSGAFRDANTAELARQYSRIRSRLWRRISVRRCSKRG